MLRSPVENLFRPARKNPSLGVSLATMFLFLAAAVFGQGSAHDYIADQRNNVVPLDVLEGIEFRDLGFTRGGRSTAVTGVVGDPLTYYFGGTGGGVFKTSDAGINWKNVSGEAFGVGSVGAIHVAPSDKNVVYVGTGSACPRGNISNGDGMYKSLDAGATWNRIGLESSGQIGRLAVHPRDPDLVYVAALGNMFGPNDERGVFRSNDGGESWEKVLFISNYTGFVDISMDPSNSRVLYAAAWRAERKPWSIISGSEEGGIWKTTDGGDTWEKLAGGLPDGLVGKIGVSVSPANPSRVWALIEADNDEGGVYRTDDAGKTWTRTNSEAKLRQRPWYYTHIYADPVDENTVYALNTGFYKSVDGGRTFPWQSSVPHGDNHDLWLNPDNPNNMINANDGGANVSFDGGKSWSWQMNQPTAEIYRVFVDDQWPYRVYGPQQDNSTISIPSRGVAAWNQMPPDWHDVGGCESGHIAIDPRDPDIVYAGCYGGSITRTDLETGDRREVITYPQLQLGSAPRDLKYRFQWNAPIRISPHDPDVVYHASQMVHRSTNGGQTWDVISPDLTYNDREQQDYSGGPISYDSTGVEVYNVVFALEESPHRAGELWAGTDDGRLHVSRDRGATWDEITPEDLPRGVTINMIDHSAHDPDRVHIAAYRYRENDFKPYIYRTNNGGKSWRLLTDGTNGIPATNFTRSVREDPVRKGLIFAGTEFGLYVSFDDGDHWQRLRNNLPVSPVTDMVIHRGDLVLSTQGRAFWSLDDLSALRQLTEDVLDKDIHLFAPKVAYRGGPSANLYFYVKEVPEEPVKLEILAGDEVLYEAEWKPDAEGGEEETSDLPDFLAAQLGRGKLEVEAGIGKLVWNLREKAPEKPEGVVHWGFTPGLAVVPGTYSVRLSSSEWSETQKLEVEPWPALETTQSQYEKQYELGKTVAQRLDQVFSAINDIRDIKGQIKGTSERFEKAGIEDQELSDEAKALTEKLESVEQKLTQVKSKSSQDPLNFPPMIDNQYVELYAYVVASDHEPPVGAYERLADLDPQLAEIMDEFAQAKTGIGQFNDLVRSKEVPAIVLKRDDDE